MPVFYDNHQNEAIQQSLQAVYSSANQYSQLAQQKKATEINQALAEKRLKLEGDEQATRTRQHQIDAQARADALKFSQQRDTEKFGYQQDQDVQQRKQHAADQAAAQSRFDDSQEQQDQHFRLQYNKDQFQKDYAAGLVSDAKTQGRDLTPEESVRAFGKLPSQMAGNNGAASLDQRQYEFGVRRAERQVQRAQKALDAVTYNEQKHLLTGRSLTVPEAPKGMEKAYQEALANLAKANEGLDAADQQSVVAQANASGGLVGHSAPIPGVPVAPPGSKGPLTRDVANQILNGAAGGDKNLARQIASQMGYTIPQAGNVPAAAPGFAQ